MFISAVFTLLNQRIICYRSSYTKTHNHQGAESLIDLVRWWDHEMPDWAKSSENDESSEIDNPDYLSFYYPNGPGRGTEDSNEDYDNEPRHYLSDNWKSNPLR